MPRHATGGSEPAEVRSRKGCSCFSGLCRAYLRMVPSRYYHFPGGTNHIAWTPDQHLAAAAGLSAAVVSPLCRHFEAAASSVPRPSANAPAGSASQDSRSSTHFFHAFLSEARSAALNLHSTFNELPPNCGSGLPCNYRVALATKKGAGRCFVARG